MKKYLKITLLVIIAIILVGTFVFLYQKSKPKVIVYETLAAEVTDLELSLRFPVLLTRFLKKQVKA